MAADVKNGNAKAFKKKTLWILEKGVVEGVTRSDPSERAQFGVDFGQRWAPTSEADLQLLFTLGAEQIEHVACDVNVLQAVASSCKKPWKKECSAICANAIHEVTPCHGPLVSLLGCMVSSGTGLKEMELHGIVLEKRKGVVKHSEARGLIHQMVVLFPIDSMLAKRVGPLLREWSGKVGMQGHIWGGYKGGRTRDVNHCVSQELEKGRDRDNPCAVAQGDSRQVPRQYPEMAFVARLVEKKCEVS